MSRAADMVWLEFVLSTVLLLAAAVKLAEYGDTIAIRTRLGGMFVGTLLLAGATSLPELLTTISSLDLNVPNMAAGNLFGSSMFNMFLVAVLDAAFWRKRVLRQVALKHALTGGLATLLTGLAVFFLLADINARIGWVGLDSLLIIVVYILGVRLLRSEGQAPVQAELLDAEHVPPLWRAMLGFAGAALLLVLVTPALVRASVGISEITGLGSGFVGTTLVGIVTSLPEMVTMLAAARIGAYDLAVGNLFGSNLFNMFALGLTDVFYTQGRFLGAIDPSFALVALLGMLLTSLGLINNVARSERRFAFVEVDAFLLMAGYLAGIYFLYARGLAG